MDKFKALSLVLLGMVIGLGYAVACGSGDDDKGTAGPMLPGVGLAMAQSGCAQWEIARATTNHLQDTGADLDQNFSDGVIASIYSVPTGWTPFTGESGGYDLWIYRCAQ
jgi:hypothetical protein